MWYIIITLSRVVVGSIIRALKVVQLPTGMLDVFLQKFKNHSCLRGIDSTN
jgi:hypothetical protein